MSIVLQKQVTLDEAIIAGVETFYNGCNVRLRVMADKTKFLELGCYALRDRAQGRKRLLFHWLGDEPKRIDNIVSPETIVELLKRKPCERCGAPFFQEQP